MTNIRQTDNLNNDNCLEELSSDMGIKMIFELLDSHNEGVIICNRNNCVIRINNSASLIFGIDIQKTLNKNIFDTFPQLAKHISIEQLKKIKSTNETTDFISEINNGTYQIKISKLIKGFIIKLIQITNNNITNTESLDNNNFKMLFENMSSGFLFMKRIDYDTPEQADFEIIDINVTLEMYLGIERQNIINKRLSQVLPSLSSLFLSKFARIAIHGRTTNEQYIHTPNGRHFEIRMYSPRIGYTAAVFYDLKTEMEIRNDLTIKNEISKAFAMGNDTNIYKIILDLLLKNSNSKYGFIGYPTDNNRNLKMLAINDDNPNYVKIDDDGEKYIFLLPQTTCASCILSKKQEDKKDIDFHNNILITPIIHETELIGIIGLADAPNDFDRKIKEFVDSLASYTAPLMAQEIKERTYKKNLIEARKKAEENEALKSSFLANLSHEIRTPLHSIEGFSSLLGLAENLTEKQKKYTKMIIKSSKQLQNTIESTLDISKIITNQVTIKNSVFNINTLLDEIKEDYQEEAENKSLYLVTKKGLENSDATTFNDYYKLKKIFSALVNNGLKFTNIGGVIFGYTFKDNLLHCFVKDTGIGICKEKHQSIYATFGQVEKSMERKYQGVGMGLSIAKGYLELMDSEINLESDTGEGALFYFDIKKNC
ncbi:MAG: ATP-binding protein [Bacteroidales bacterium]|nr:ATP-binding protein [Bacteroidales bacterium]